MRARWPVKHQPLVGASLLAMAMSQSTSMLSVIPLSRAGSLPQGFITSLRGLLAAHPGCSAPSAWPGPVSCPGGCIARGSSR
ncbi:hypothetical protein DZG01_29455 [Pseudomonas fluorescens]|nr:hypothetical protein DZG01_29455 [Pseudomonas fluorescens]